MANAVEAGGSNGYDGGGAGPGPGGGGSRPPRLPRWTRQEILVLIQGKRVAEGRGRGRGGGGTVMVVGGVGPVEPKWATVSSYCRRHGVNRGPVQCRKRWSNLASDFKKIKEWEEKGKESFWSMRNDLRRQRRLPGFFDREVYDILDGTAAVAEEEDDVVKGGRGETKTAAENEAVFDSGRTAAEDGLFSDFDEEKEIEEEEEEQPPPPPPPPAAAAAAAAAAAVAAVPISEKYEASSQLESSDQATAKDKPLNDNPERSPSEEGAKRRRTSHEEAGDSNFQSQLIEVLERNSRILTSQLEAHNTNCQLDRDQRKEQTTSLLGILGKLADALGRIADKL